VLAIEVTNSHVSPQLLLDRLPETVRQAGEQALFIAAFAISEELLEVLLYGTREVDLGGAESVAVAGTVGLVEWANGEIESRGAAIAAELPLVSNPHDLIEPATWEAVMHDPAEATRHVYTHDVRGPNDPDVMPRLIVGKKFERTLVDLGLDAQPRRLHRVYFLAAMAIVGRLDQVNGAQLHWVRTSEAADAPQVEREDGAKKWRCMVTKQGAGYRLHYWSLPAGGVELDAVLVESEV